MELSQKGSIVCGIGEWNTGTYETIVDCAKSNHTVTGLRATASSSTDWERLETRKSRELGGRLFLKPLMLNLVS